MAWDHRPQSCRKKPTPAFPANEECLGGAHMILKDYMNLYERAASTGPSRGVVGGLLRQYGRQQMTPAQRLSRNRAARRAAVDTTAAQHIGNVHHLTRRIEDMYSETERRKNPHDPTVYPSMERRSRPMQRMPGMQQQLLEPWVEGYGYGTLLMHPRPASAEAGQAHSHTSMGGDHYQGWSVTSSLRDTFPADDFPLTRYPTKQPVQRESVEAQVYRTALMREIVHSRLYKERDLKQLFATYLKQAPLYDKQVVEQVVQELKRELLVD